MSGLRDAQAFPGAVESKRDGYAKPEVHYAPGMTYRQAAALKILSGFGHVLGHAPEELADLALERADALIAALEGTPAEVEEEARPRARSLAEECPVCQAAPGAQCRNVFWRPWSPHVLGPTEGTPASSNEPPAPSK